MLSSRPKTMESNCQLKRQQSHTSSGVIAHEHVFQSAFETNNYLRKTIGIIEHRLYEPLREILVKDNSEEKVWSHFWVASVHPMSVTLQVEDVSCMPR